MLKLLLVIAVVWPATTVKDDFRESIRPEVSSDAADAITIRFYRDGEKADPPIHLRDSLRLAASHGDKVVSETAKRILVRHFADTGYLSASVDSIVHKPGATDKARRDAPVGSTPPPLSGNSRTISVYASAGCRYTIESVNYRLADADAALMDRFISFYGDGDAFDGPSLQAEFRRVVRHLEGQGRPLARLEIAKFHPDSDACLVHIEADIFAGEELRASGVVTNEVGQVSPGYIQTASGIRENDKITPSLFRRGKRNLENTGFFREVSDGDLMLRDGNAYIYYEVREQRANHFDLIFGYVPGQSSGRDIVGRGEMRIRNVGWTGSSLNLMFERLDDMVTKLETGFEREWILGQPLGAGADFRFIQQDTSYQIREIHLMGSYRSSPERRYSLHLTQRQTSAGDDPNLPITVLDGVTRAAGFGFRYDNTDSRFTPRSGMLFDLYVESGFRRLDDPRAETLQSRGTMMQQRVRTSLKTYYSPFRRQVLALGLHGSLVESPEYTETDVVPLGGARSLRGYREEQFRVARYAWSDLELRYLLDPLSHAFLFGAVGAYERPAMLGREEEGTQGWLYSGGFGFRFQTPLGLMQFTYAISADDDLLNGKVHFSLTAGF